MGEIEEPVSCPQLRGEEYLVDLLWRLLMEMPIGSVELEPEFDEALHLLADHYGPEHERGKLARAWLGD